MTVSFYNKLAKEFSDTLFRYAVKMTADADDAKDIVQDSFTKLWENLADIENGYGKRWLFKTAYNIVVDNSRKQAVKNKYLQTLGANTVSAAYNDEREYIDYCINRMPDFYKTVLLLRDEQGYSYAEIAEMTDSTLETVKITIYRARTKMKKLWMQQQSNK